MIYNKLIFFFQASKTKIGSVNKPPSLASCTSASNQVKSGYPLGASTNSLVPIRSSSSMKLAGAFPTSLPRATAPRLVAAGNVKRNSTHISYFDKRLFKSHLKKSENIFCVSL